MNAEFWLPVTGYEKLYEVSDLGRVRSKNGILKPGINSTGYRSVCLHLKGQQRVKPVGHLVLDAFHGPRPVGFVMCHGPNGKQDDRASALAWGSKSDNNGRDRRRDGTDSRGERNGRSKLTEQDVRLVRCWIECGYRNQEIADAFSVTRSAIYSIQTNRAWAWLGATHHG